MFPGRRKFRRFDIPVEVEFKPNSGETEQHWGITKNFSCKGLSLESYDFDFGMNRKLEFKLKFPESSSIVSLMGNIVWEKQIGNRSLAGIEFKMMNHHILNKMLQEICSHRKISLDDVLFSRDSGYSVKEVSEQKSSAATYTERKSYVSVKTETTGFTKQYLKNGKCNVTFRLPKAAAPDVRNIAIVGDFNDWNTVETPMERLKNGDFRITLTLTCGREYRFRYLIDGNRWENDWHADKYIPNAFGSDDSVVVL